MIAASASMCPKDTFGAKVRAFDRNGEYVRTITNGQALTLLAANLAEQRGATICMMAATGGGRVLDGLHTVKHSDGVKNCRGFATMPAGGAV